MQINANFYVNNKKQVIMYGALIYNEDENKSCKTTDKI